MLNRYSGYSYHSIYVHKKLKKSESYFIKKSKHPLKDVCYLLSVIRSGFEPETHSLEGCCSIQLSYRTIISIIE